MTARVQLAVHTLPPSPSFFLLRALVGTEESCAQPPQNDTSTYLFGPDEVEGARCQSSWNKLWGGGRCGYLNFHHYDSDRFVWRRHVRSCI
jgi:hypothetical protein